MYIGKYVYPTYIHIYLYEIIQFIHGETPEINIYVQGIKYNCFSCS